MNLLSLETSPYLLQHKDNPVHWRPWGSAAFEAARREQKPVLLSIGYSACHWCHVMAHESFEDSDVAAVMNTLFICVKVDREERPDVDQVYMAALHTLGEQGGWPMTMFLTAEGDPFWGGTYFPKTARYGRPGFVSVMQQIADAYQAQPDRIARNTSAIRGALGQSSIDPEEQRGITDADLDTLAASVEAAMDRENGGLRGTQKFPNASLLLLLWRRGLQAGNERYHRSVTHTLTRMCLGGIFDHVGGGFSRYTVDKRWLVPHFEKMLYDNAQLLELLSLAWQKTGAQLFEDAARETVSWLEREMLATPHHAFAAALDADSEGQEGKYYVWSAKEIRALLDESDAALFMQHYDVSEAGNWEHANIPNRLDTPVPSPEQAQALARIRATLLAHRQHRIPPGRDDKILADWNGMMIVALARASVVFGEPHWLSLATAAFKSVTELTGRDDRLGHSWRQDKLIFPGFASDHGAMILAALALWEADAKGPYRAQAEAWAAVLDTHHLDPDTGLYALAARDTHDLPLRYETTADEATPNHNAMIAEGLVRLAAATGSHDYVARADTLFAASGSRVLASPLAHAGIANALDLRLNGVEIVIIGQGEEAEALAGAARTLPAVRRSLLVVESAGHLPGAHPACAAPTLVKPVSYLCRDGRCSLPLHSAQALLAAIRG
jgi:uncharacterized protein